MSDSCDVVVVGGGAAGLAAAIFAAETARAAGRSLSVAVLDGAPRLGTKILVSGGGRCNVTNSVVTAEDFNGSRGSIRRVLGAFDQLACRRWFRSLGVELKVEQTGKLFPVSNRAQTVLHALLRRCADLGVRLQCGKRVLRIERRSVANNGEFDFEFIIHHGAGSMRAPCLILATGGRSLPRSGSDGSGWRLAEALGHSVTPVWPALVPLLLDASFFHTRLAGISVPVELVVQADGKPYDRRRGSLLWTHFGISGPVVLDTSRHWLAVRQQTNAVVALRCNLVPGRDFDAIDRELMGLAVEQPRLTLLAAVGRLLPGRFSAVLLEHLQTDSNLPLAELSRRQRREVTHALTELVLPVRGSRGWNHAEVTAGGVPLSEIDPSTMQSRLVPRLFLAGEMLDCEGRIGGFNFQWAWATGYLAGRAAAYAGH